MCCSKFNLLLNLIPRYVVESHCFIGMSFKENLWECGLFRFNLAVEILMSSVLVELSSKSFFISQLCKSVRQFCN